MAPTNTSDSFRVFVLQALITSHWISTSICFAVCNEGTMPTYVKMTVKCNTYNHASGSKQSFARDLSWGLDSLEVAVTSF